MKVRSFCTDSLTSGGCASSPSVTVEMASYRSDMAGVV